MERPTLNCTVTLLLLVLAMLACSSGTPEPVVSTAGDEPLAGDLADLRQRGSLRILMPLRDPTRLPRRGYALDLERGLAEALARRLGLEPEVVHVAERQQLFDALAEGRGDLIVARLTATRERRRRYAFSVPLQRVRELLVCRTGTPIEGRADLAGRQIAVRPSSSYRETLERLQAEGVPLEIVPVPEFLDTEQIAHEVALGRYDATVIDEDIFREIQAYRDDLKAPMALTGARPIAWALRVDAVKLKGEVDRFLQEQSLASESEQVLGDLDRIVERRVLRVLTRNNAANYFIHRGARMGFEFELARRFAESIGCRIRVIVPPSQQQLIPWLLEGRGDLIAASMTVTPEREASVAFTRPYLDVREVVVGRPGEVPTELDRLQGRRFAVRRSSAYYETLVRLRQELGFDVEEAPPAMETEQLIAAVADGRYDLTVADSHLLDIELTYRDDVAPGGALTGDRPLAWAVRREDADLLEAADGFLESVDRGLFFNTLRRKYFKDRRRLAPMARIEAPRSGRLSPFDDAFRRLGRKLEIDWRLLAAQAFEESRFDPQAVSWAGAVGLMQVLPETAAELGIDGELTDPEVSVEAGARYLRKLIDGFEPGLDEGERIRFALAAYNAGRGHVLDGRRLAREQGRDPDVWFDHVESVMPLLSRRSVAERMRFGYCRCSETVAYVRRILDRYEAYVRLLDSGTVSY